MAYTYSHLYGIPATGLRFFTVYGPYGRPDMAYFKFANKIRKGEPIQIYNHGDMYRDFTYVDDIVTGIENMLCNPPKENKLGDRYKIYNIGNHKPEQLMHFIEVLEKALGKTAEKNTCPCSPAMSIRPMLTSANCNATLILSQKRRLKKDWENLPNGTGHIII